MRILHVVLTPRFSGAEVLVRDLATLHNACGHPSAVVALAPSEPAFRSVIEQMARSGVNWQLPQHRLKKLERVRFLREKIAEFAPDAILAHSVIPAAYARIADGRRVVSVLHSDSNYESHQLAWSEHVLQYRAAGVIAVSSRAAAQYSRRFRRPKLAVIPNGIALENVYNAAAKRQHNRISFGLESNARVILQVGRILEVKQQHLTLHALAPLLNNNPALRIWFAGLMEDANYTAHLKDWVVKQRLEKQIAFLGSRADVPELMSAADLIVMPSAQEAHSLALMEALASGAPIVASAISSFQYASKFDGVALLSPEDFSAYRSAAEIALTESTRFDRDLRGYDIGETAANYLDFLRETIYRG
jgi:glycosyltransferase involved in cell wall biosynthesis